MSKFRYFWALSSFTLGAVILLSSLLQPERWTVGMVFGVLLILSGVIRLYLGSEG
jgi:uncharacterized membrane protein